MIIRKTITSDLDDICLIYQQAREFMRENGNAEQWGLSHPARELVARDIEVGKSYVCLCDDEIIGVFYFNIENEPTYAKIDGEWQSDKPYGVVHRIAVKSDTKGVGTFCLQWCFEQCHNIRIDTHRDNIPMRSLLEKLGYKYCGIIWIPIGEERDERMAFQKSITLQ